MNTEIIFDEGMENAKLYLDEWEGYIIIEGENFEIKLDVGDVIRLLKKHKVI